MGASQIKKSARNSSRMHALFQGTRERRLEWRRRLMVLVAGLRGRYFWVWIPKKVQLFKDLTKKMTGMKRIFRC